MKPGLPQRQSQRLKNYDYSQTGAYFITLCAAKRMCLFGDIRDDEIHLNEFGEIVKRCWHNLVNHYPNIELDSFVVMPNHVHGIICIVGAGLKPAPTRIPLTEIVRALKTFSSRKINQIRKLTGVPVWQRGFYDHVIRNDESLNRIRDYIATNLLRWHLDRENPHADGKDEFDGWLARFRKVNR
jgi:REP element-mobilizing transposase RayT